MRSVTADLIFLKEIVEHDPVAKRKFLQEGFLRDTLTFGHVCVVKHTVNRIF